MKKERKKERIEDENLHSRKTKETKIVKFCRSWLQTRPNRTICPELKFNEIKI